MNAKAIQAITNAGADAMSNIFDIFIKFPWATGEETMVRATGFNPPKAAIQTYKVQYHGVAIDRPRTEQNFERSFTIDFRLDAAYGLHALFIQWQQAVVDPVNGGVANYAAALGSVKVRALGGNYTAAEEAKTLVDTAGEISRNEMNPVYKFDKVWVSDVGQPQYKTDGGNFMTFQVKFHFADTDYPFYNGAGANGTDANNN